MGKKKIPGLRKRYGVWQIDKYVLGQRICESTGTSKLEEAEAYLAKRIDDTRLSKMYGLRQSYTFEQAAARYVLEYSHMASFHSDALPRLKQLMPHIGSIKLDKLNQGALGRACPI